MGFCVVLEAGWEEAEVCLIASKAWIQAMLSAADSVLLSTHLQLWYRAILDIPYQSMCWYDVSHVASLLL